MVVDSYLELFTTLFGWMLYDRLWDLLTGIGVAYIPLAWIIFNNLVESHRDSDAGTATGTSLHRMEVDLGLALTVVVLAGQPILTLNSASLRYTPPPTYSNPTPVTATVAAPGVTYGSSGFRNAPGSAEIPIWWAGILAIASGINQAALGSLPATIDLRTYQQMAKAARIEDPVLRQEVNDFYSQCYIPARSKYLTERPNTPSTQTLLSSHGNDDPDWIGSHVYLSTYYTASDMRAATPLAGFPYSPLRDTEYDPASPPPAGRPYCAEWWQGVPGATGLKDKLVGAAGNLDSIAASITAGFDPIKRQDAIAKTVLNNDPPSMVNTRYADTNNATSMGVLPTLETLMQKLASTIGVFVMDIMQGVVMYAILQGLPMMQAVLLMGIYALLPFAIIASRYSLDILYVGALGLFTVKFWTFLWALAHWADQNLIASLYPDARTFLEFGTNDWTGTAQKRIILDLVTTSLYLGLPVLWTTMMAWVGYKGLGAIDAVQKQLIADVAQGGKRGVPRRFR